MRALFSGTVHTSDGTVSMTYTDENSSSAYVGCFSVPMFGSASSPLRLL